MARIAWLGNWSQPEFLALHREGLEETTPFSGDLFDNVQDLVASLHGETFPDLVLVAQSWSDEYPSAAIDRLIRLSPLTRWICCYGSWCDADGRTRDLWPPGCRVPAWRFLTRLHQELGLLTLGRTQALPLTASREEIFAQDYVTPQTTLDLNVHVDSPDPAYGTFLSEACRSLNLPLNASAPGLILFDLDPDSQQREQEFERLRRQFPDAQVLGLKGFSNPDQSDHWTSRGVTRIASKLAPVSELARLISNRIPQGGPAAPRPGGAATLPCALWDQ